MNHPAPASSRPLPTRRRVRAALLLAAGLGAGVLVGCGSSGGSATATEPTELCDAVEQYVEEVEAGDRTGSADALAPAVEGLPDEDQRVLAAFVAALRGAPASNSPDGDGVTSAATEEAFHAYVTEECGEDALPSPEEATTTTTAAPDAGGDSGGTNSGTDSGTGTGTEGGTGTDGDMSGATGS